MLGTLFCTGWTKQSYYFLDNSLIALAKLAEPKKRIKSILLFLKKSVKGIKFASAGLSNKAN